MPNAPELFLATHSKVGLDGQTVLPLERDRIVYDKAYEDLRHKAEENAIEVDPNERWFKASQPLSRGHGMGSAQSIYYGSQAQSRTRGMFTYIPGPYCQLEKELEAEKKRSSEIYVWMEQQKKKEEERDEREKKMQEELEMMRTRFEMCI